MFDNRHLHAFSYKHLSAARIKFSTLELAVINAEGKTRLAGGIDQLRLFTMQAFLFAVNPR